jgi:hypothetical protein
MFEEEKPSAPNGVSPFERIRRTNAAGAEYGSSRDFGQVILKARAAYLNSSQRIEDHFVEITEMVPIGSEAKVPKNRPGAWRNHAGRPPARREHKEADVQETQTTKSPGGTAR